MVVLPPPPHATPTMHPPSTRTKREKLNSFLRLALFRPAPPSNNAGMIRPSAKSVPEPWPSAGVRADCAPLVVTVTSAVPLAGEIEPTEQVAAGVFDGVTLQLRATFEALSPPTAVMVTVDVAEAPGETVDGDKSPTARLNPGAITTNFMTLEELPL